jgi:cytoskeletal protein CcmA (bactofilin family)
MGLTQVKIELGSDGNTSSGTEPATKRSADDVANVLRGAGFHFAADAKSINPSIEVSLLRWADPAWVKTDEDRYQWYKQTIDAAYDTYGLVVDWLSPNKNETAANVAWISYVGRRLRQDTEAGQTRYDYSKIKLATSDELDTSNMAKDMVTMVDPATLTQDQKDAARTPDPNQTKAKAEAVDPANSGVLWKTSYPQYGSATYYYRIANQAYLSLISALTHHYTVNTTPAMAVLNRTYGLEIWFSEGVAGIGQGMAIQNEGLQDEGQTALDVADLFINSYDNAGNSANSGGYPTTVPEAHHSLYMFQPAVAAFPQATTYSTKAAVDAYDPWSGAYDRDLTYFVAKQFADFARSGTKAGADQAAQVGQVDNDGAWRYVEGGASAGDGHLSGHSIAGAGASHLALAAPDRGDFSLILNNHTDDTLHYTITTKNMAVADKARLAVYRTQVKDGAAFDSNWFQRLGDIDVSHQNADGSFTFTFTVAPQSINTLTTLDDTRLPAPHVAGDGTVNAATRSVLDQSTPTDGTVYSDDFEYAGYPAAPVAWDYASYRPGSTDPTTNATDPAGPSLSYLDRRGNTPRYSDDMNGAFEVDGDGTGNHALVQQLDYNHIPGCWTCGAPETLIGDDRWANYTVSADVRFDTATAPNAGYANYIGLGGRSNQEGNGYEFLLRPDSAWGIVQDAGDAASAAASMTGTNTLAHGTLSGFHPAGAHRVAVTMRYQTVSVTVDGHPVTTWKDPDGLNTRLAGRVHLVSGWYRNSFDNLTVTRVPGYPATLAGYVDDGDDRLQYNGDVSHYLAGASALYRSGTLLSAGGSFSLGFQGTGFLLEAETSQSGAINVTVDGKAVATGVPVSAGRTRNDGYALTDLPDGPHTVQVTSTTGGLRLDSVGVYGAVAPGGGTAALRATIDQYAQEALKAGDYSADSWQAYQAALAAARAVVASPPPAQAAIDGARDALIAAHDGLVPADTPVAIATTLPVITTQAGRAPDYTPLTSITTVGVRLAGGTTVQRHVTWPDNLPGAEAFAGPFDMATIHGTVEGTTLVASATAIVLPGNLVYVVDSGRAGLDSPVFDAARTAQPGIVNDVPDQAYADGAGWGYNSEDPTASEAGDPADWHTSWLGDSNDTDGLIYHLTLDPGSYQLTAVHSTLRALNAESWIGIDGQKVDDKTYPVGTSSPTTVTHSFTLTRRSEVTFEASRIGSSGYNVRLAMVYVAGQVSRPAVVSGSSLTLTNQFTVSGGDQPDLHVNGDFACNSQVHVAGDVVATGDAYLTNGCTIGGDLRVGGDVVMDSTPSVGGDVIAVGQVRFQSTAHIGGDVHAGGAFTVTDGVSVDKLRATGRIGGQVLTGQTVDAPAVDAWTGAAYDPAVLPGTTPITWRAWMNATATANAAPSWSAGLGADPGCVMAPWASSVNGATVDVDVPTVVDARGVTSGCDQVSLQQLTLRLRADLVLYADSIQSVNGLHVVSADGGHHTLKLIVPGDQVDCGGGKDIALSASTVVDPTVTAELHTPGRTVVQTGSQLGGQLVAGCVSSSGTVTLRSAG